PPRTPIINPHSLVLRLNAHHHTLPYSLSLHDALPIYNVVEADFFDWVLSAEHGRAFIRHLSRRIAAFTWHNVEHDVLKVLYESIIKPTTRKSMGEYYTPDWLAEGIVTKAVTKPLEQKVLDPSCGSGTFIFHTVRHIIRAATEAGWD